MLTVEDEVVADVEVLSIDEAATVVHTLMELRPHWITRNLYAPFYTMGAASYLDAADNSCRYKNWLADSNPILQEKFAWVYDRLLQKIEHSMGAPAAYAEDLALPGFHIYLSSPLFERPVASVHFDSQFDLHRWSESAALAHPISFTLSVALPRNGGGLYTWKIEKEEIAGKSDAEILQLTRTHSRDFHPYAVGHLALHSGNVLHQAAPGHDLGPDDMRITLQGHGVQVDGIWQLYW